MNWTREAVKSQRNAAVHENEIRHDPRWRTVISLCNDWLDQEDEIEWLKKAILAEREKSQDSS